MKTIMEVIYEKLYHQQIDEKLVFNKHTKAKKDNYYILVAIYEGFDYLADEIGDAMIVGDKGSGPSIFIVDYNTLIILDKKYFIVGSNYENGTISIWHIPEKYQDDIDKFGKDYYDGKINLEDDCEELNNNELDNILNDFK